MKRVEVIEPCPYINGFGADNKNVKYAIKRYDTYLDYVEFENGKPVKCTRIYESKCDLWDGASAKEALAKAEQIAGG